VLHFTQPFLSGQSFCADSVMCLLQALTEEELMEVLTKPRNALSRQYERMLEMSRTGLHITSAAIRAIARAALERGTGARGLRSIMEGLLQPVMFEVWLPSSESCVSCLLPQIAGA
jgi:ATP-dependent Clp protease ATP-binding subunit ClpX